MRELKFRVYDKTGGYYIAILDNDCFSIKQVARIILELAVLKHEYIIEQYTGLKDKNGKEICEWDILLDYYDGEDAFIVEWNKDTASFILTDTDNILNVSFDNFYSDKELEVIGNIHENPELLGVKNVG